MYLTSTDVIRFKNQAESAIARAKAKIDKADHAIETAVRTAEVSLASFTFGVLTGRARAKGAKSALFGVPADLLSGVALHVAGLAGLGGKSAHHLHAFGDGAIAAFFTTLGAGVGADWATSGKLLPGTKSQGAITGGASMADEELARMVAAAGR